MSQLPSNDPPGPLAKVAEPTGKPIPAWTSVLIIAACLAGVAFLGWKYWNGAAAADRIEVLPRDPLDKVSSSWGSYQVVGGMGIATIARPVGAHEPTIKFEFGRFDYVTPEQQKVLSAVEQIVDKDPGRWKADLGLSDAQLATLKAVRERRKEGLQLDPADEKRIRTLFAEYEPLSKAAEKPRPARGATQPATIDPAEKARRAAEMKLCDAVEEVVRKKVPVIRRITADRTTAAKAALTPEQWAKYESLSTSPGR